MLHDTYRREDPFLDLEKRYCILFITNRDRKGWLPERHQRTVRGQTDVANVMMCVGWVRGVRVQGLVNSSTGVLLNHPNFLICLTKLFDEMKRLTFAREGKRSDVVCRRRVFVDWSRH